eukprot:383961_1
MSGQQNYVEPPGLNRQASSQQFDEIFNSGSEIDILHRESEYNFNFKAVQVHPKQSISSALLKEQADAAKYVSKTADDIDDDPQIEVLKDELKIIYTKIIFVTLLVVALSAGTMIAAIIQSFYNWNGIAFNTFVVIVGLYGLLILFCLRDREEGTHFSTKKNKLKHLLIYFIISLACIFTVFIIALVYTVLLPLRVSRNDEYSGAFLAGAIISGVVGVIFWTILVSFYIDLCARACLKRGRIGFIIIEIDSRFWNGLYRFVIWFRIKFRTFRRCLTAITGMRCIKGSIKLYNPNPNKLHEEERALAILEYDENTCTICECKKCEINLHEKVSHITKTCNKIVCCCCIVCDSIFEKINPFMVMGVLLFCALFAPLAMYLLLMLLVSPPFILCLKEANAAMGVGVVIWMGVGMVIWMGLAGVLLYVVWYASWGICPNNYFNTDRFPKGEWNWTSQCLLWDWASLILIILAGRSMGGDTPP